MNFPLQNNPSETFKTHYHYTLLGYRSSPELLHLKTVLPPTYKGKLFSVEYFANMYFKHDAWNETGRGHEIKLPLVISDSEFLQPNAAIG